VIPLTAPHSGDPGSRGGRPLSRYFRGPAGGSIMIPCARRTSARRTRATVFPGEISPLIGTNSGGGPPGVITVPGDSHRIGLLSSRNSTHHPGTGAYRGVSPGGDCPGIHLSGSRSAGRDLHARPATVPAACTH